MTVNPIKIFKRENTYDLHVMWAIHNKCNYACSYCPDNLHNGDITKVKLDTLKGFVDKVRRHYVDRFGYKNILFSMTGGEPTLWKGFLPFVEYCHEKGLCCGLTSNGSVSLRFWERVSSYFDYICLSFHPESADPDNFLKTYKFLHDHPKTVIPSIRVMMHPKDSLWEKSVALVEKLKKFPNWTYQCVHILDDYGSSSKKIDYASKEKEEYLLKNAFVEQYKDNRFVYLPKVGFNYGVEYEDHTFETLDENKLINKNQVNFKGWDCNIGLEQLFILYDGNIFRAGCQVGGYLGNIFDYEKIKFPIGSVKCYRNACYCPTDIRISKRRSQEPAGAN